LQGLLHLLQVLPAAKDTRAARHQVAGAVSVM
jgi:hypothetical protein